ncbi:MAG: hypothetical protein IKN69_04645 [Bacilli bacterium]|nr:hypothetical protein [Bacilli bacterium]
MDAEIRNCEICPESSACALSEREECVLDEKPDRFAEEDFQAFEKQYMEDYKDEIVSPYDRRAGLVDGMKWQKEKYLKGALMEPSSEGLEEEIERCWKDWISSEEDEVEGLLIKSEFEKYARHFTQWQRAQIAARDKTLDYYTFEQKPRKRRVNPKTQFELKTISRKDLIKEAYEWCKQNLPLKDERGIIFQVDELFIITSSQSVIDKVNNHFGSNFGFGLKGETIFFLM